MEATHLCGVIYATLTPCTWASVSNDVCLGICVLSEQAGLAKPMGPVDGFMRGK